MSLYLELLKLSKKELENVLQRTNKFKCKQCYYRERPHISVIDDFECDNDLCIENNKIRHLANIIFNSEQ